MAKPLAARMQRGSCHGLPGGIIEARRHVRRFRRRLRPARRFPSYRIVVEDLRQAGGDHAFFQVHGIHRGVSSDRRLRLGAGPDSGRRRGRRHHADSPFERADRARRHGRAHRSVDRRRPVVGQAGRPDPGDRRSGASPRSRGHRAASQAGRPGHPDRNRPRGVRRRRGAGERREGRLRRRAGGGGAGLRHDPRPAVAPEGGGERLRRHARREAALLFGRRESACPRSRPSRTSTWRSCR